MTLPPMSEDEARRLAALKSLSRDVLARQQLRHAQAIKMRQVRRGLLLLVVGAVLLFAAGVAWVLMAGVGRPLAGP
jgi:hypothetical protein